MAKRKIKEHCSKCNDFTMLRAKGKCSRCYWEDYHFSKTPEEHRLYVNASVERSKRYFEINYVHLTFKMDVKCSRCGYDKNFKAICSHHLDPSQKEGTKDSLSVWMRESPVKFISILEREKDKFILLCNRCHIEVHDEEPELTTQWGKKPQKYGLGENNAISSI